jgi:hypothetical protein
MKSAIITARTYGTETIYEIRVPYYVKQGEEDRFYSLIFLTLKEAIAALISAHVTTFCILGTHKEEPE